MVSQAPSSTQRTASVTPNKNLVVLSRAFINNLLPTPSATPHNLTTLLRITRHICGKRSPLYHTGVDSLLMCSSVGIQRSIYHHNHQIHTGKTGPRAERCKK